MSFHEIVKRFFMVLIAFTILGLFSMISMGKYQKAYNKKRQEYRNAPQIHVNATERYVEAVMEGKEDTSRGIKARAPKKYYLPFFKRQEVAVSEKCSKARFYDKPLYVRDKNAPKKLRPYKQKRYW